jgi:hypothetical protein
MDCPSCTTYISAKHLFTVGLCCPECNIQSSKLAKEINNWYSTIAYMISHKNIVIYVGSTTNLYNRLHQHLSSDVIFEILQEKVSLNHIVLQHYSIAINISIHLSEYSLYHIYKPSKNTNIPPYSVFRINKGFGKYQDFSDNIPPKYINSLTLDITPKSNKNNYTYCYLWYGQCYCKLPCRILLALLKYSNNCNDAISQIKHMKYTDRLDILKLISNSAYNTYILYGKPTYILKLYKPDSIKYINNYTVSEKKYIYIIQKFCTKSTSMPNRSMPIFASSINTHTSFAQQMLHEYNTSKKSIPDIDNTIIKPSRVYSQVTLKNYNYALDGIAKGYNAFHKSVGLLFTMPITLINNPDSVYLYLASLTSSTAIQKTTAIIWKFRSMYADNNSSVSIPTIYIYIQMMYLFAGKRDATVQHNNHALTLKEQVNFIKWEDILHCRDTLESTIDTSSLHDMTDFLIVCLYTYQPPIRADYANMRVFVFDADVPLNYTSNYCVVHTNTPRFVFWKYKTANGLQPTVINIHPHLHLIILKWLDINTSPYLLVSHSRGLLAPMNENTLSTRVKSIFARFTGKAASINTLRHAFISYSSRNDQAIALKGDNARMMMHSSSMADAYRRYVY